MVYRRKIYRRKPLGVKVGRSGVKKTIGRSGLKRIGRRPLGYKSNRNMYMMDLAGGLSAAAAVNIANRFRAADPHNPRKARANVAHVEVAETTSSQKKWGRTPKLTLSSLSKIVKTGLTSSILRYQSMKPYMTPYAGANKLVYHTNKNANSALNVTTYPVHVYDVSSFMNGYANTTNMGNCLLGAPAATGAPNSSIGQAGITFVLLNNTSSGFQRHQQANGTVNTAATGRQWIQETSDSRTDNSSGMPVTSSLWKWVDMRLQLYGRSNRPTKFDVMLCNIAEDIAIDAYTGSDNGYLWTQLADPYIYHPLHTYASGRQVKPLTRMKILKKETVELGSVTTTEGSTTVPHTHSLKWFWKCNRSAKWDWSSPDSNLVRSANMPQGAGAAGTGTDANPGDFATDTQQVKDTLDPRRRVYLIIRAQTTYTEATGADFVYAEGNNDNNPSYDILVRTCHEYSV